MIQDESPCLFLPGHAGDVQKAHVMLPGILADCLRHGAVAPVLLHQGLHLGLLQLEVAAQQLHVVGDLRPVQLAPPLRLGDTGGLGVLQLLPGIGVQLGQLGVNALVLLPGHLCLVGFAVLLLLGHKGLGAGVVAGKGVAHLCKVGVHGVLYSFRLFHGPLLRLRLFRFGFLLRLRRVFLNVAPLHQITVDLHFSPVIQPVFQFPGHVGHCQAFGKIVLYDSF